MTKVKSIKFRLKANSVILIFTCFLFTTIATGQEKKLHGKITNSKDVEGIHILNRTSGYNTITNKDGDFLITIKENDTLFISSVHYMPTKYTITQTVFQEGTLVITLQELVNELDEVVLGPNLTGNLAVDLKNIKTEKPLNFDDVGIPGFKGEPEEKIVPIVPGVGILTAVDLEALYKHLSGYYKKLRIKRKWEAENQTVAQLINFYTPKFFEDAYRIPEDRLYDFLLYCIETSNIQDDFRTENYVGVLQTFKTKAVEYVKRLSEKEE